MSIYKPYRYNYIAIYVCEKEEHGIFIIQVLHSVDFSCVPD